MIIISSSSDSVRCELRTLARWPRIAELRLNEYESSEKFASRDWSMLLLDDSGPRMSSTVMSSYAVHGIIISLVNCSTSESRRLISSACLCAKTNGSAYSK